MAKHNFGMVKGQKLVTPTPSFPENTLSKHPSQFTCDMDNNINNNNNSPLTIALDLQEHGGVRIDCQTSSLYQKYLETRYYRGQLEQCQHQLWYQQQHLYTELEEVKQRERLYRQQYQEWAQQTANSAPAYSSLVPPSTTISSPSGQHSLQQISAQLEIHSSAPPEACHSTFRTALISAPEQASLFPWSPANTADLVVSNLFPDLSVPPPTPQLVHDTCHQHHSNSDSSNDSSSTYNIAKENKSNTNAINTNVNINANSNANANASENVGAVTYPTLADTIDSVSSMSLSRSAEETPSPQHCPMLSDFALALVTHTEPHAVNNLAMALPMEALPEATIATETTTATAKVVQSPPPGPCANKIQACPTSSSLSSSSSSSSSSSTTTTITTSSSSSSSSFHTSPTLSSRLFPSPKISCSNRKAATTARVLASPYIVASSPPPSSSSPTSTPTPTTAPLVKLHLCPVPNCNKAFTRASNLRTHTTTHSKDKPFLCEHDGCTSRFARIHDMKRHLRIHTKDLPYACVICNERFVRNDPLWRHYHHEHPNDARVPERRSRVSVTVQDFS